MTVCMYIFKVDKIFLNFAFFNMKGIFHSELALWTR